MPMLAIAGGSADPTPCCCGCSHTFGVIAVFIECIIGILRLKYAYVHISSLLAAISIALMIWLGKEAPPVSDDPDEHTEYAVRQNALKTAWIHWSVGTVVIAFAYVSIIFSKRSGRISALQNPHAILPTTTNTETPAPPDPQ
jgi:hypothetical protein